jgi:hypothetical protein
MGRGKRETRASLLMGFWDRRFAGVFICGLWTENDPGKVLGGMEFIIVHASNCDCNKV